MSFEIKDFYNFDDLIEVMKYLRAPDGCPWDKEQTHKSIRSNLIEETYEVVEAIDNNDSNLLKEELGDLLLQVVFHSQIADEGNNFNINDVVNDVCQKLVFRHPHVFGQVEASNSDEALNAWDNVKMQSKSHKKQSQAMESVAKTLPSLMRATKIQSKAAKIGFEFESADCLFDKINKNVAELKNTVDDASQVDKSEKLGDLLFSVVGASRFLSVDSEESLYNSCDKFINRFKAMENLAVEKDIDIKTASKSELASLWDEVK